MSRRNVMCVCFSENLLGWQINLWWVVLMIIQALEITGKGTTGPLVQFIEQAHRLLSSVEWLFPCSMRTKRRHRAGVSALQPPGTPLALLDELHEG